MIKVTLDDVMGTDLSPVMDAKVSFDADASVTPQSWECVELTHTLSRDQPVLTDRQKGLIKFLVRGMTGDEYEDLLHEVANCATEYIPKLLWKFRNTPVHAAPFGHCYLKFTVEAPVFVTRQLVKHEYLRMSEVSRRYIKGLPVYFTPDNWAGIAEDIKQGAGDPLPLDVNEEVNSLAHNAIDTADRAYRALLKYVAPEEARMILPLCHMTRWRWSGSLDAVMNMCNLRLDSHAQSQTREVARQVGEYVKKAFPQSWASYVEGDI
jgi:thymidylate synthase (FAD)